jgi:hypothetical protein
MHIYPPQSHANVVIVSELSDRPIIARAKATRFSTLWCVDSGANRDMCNEIKLFNGRAKPKTLTIGEAGKGHSFLSQGEGPISLQVRGKALPLFSRTIYADKVHDNVMSVGESCDPGYVMLFDSERPMLFDPKDIKIIGKPILSGFRDAVSRLYYFDFPSPLLCPNDNQKVPDTPEARVANTTSPFNPTYPIFKCPTKWTLKF